MDCFSRFWESYLQPAQVGYVVYQCVVAVPKNTRKTVTVGHASVEKHFAACFFSMVLQLQL